MSTILFRNGRYSIRYRLVLPDGTVLRVRLSDPSWTANRGLRYMRSIAPEMIARDKAERLARLGAGAVAPNLKASAPESALETACRAFLDWAALTRSPSTISNYKKIIRLYFLKPCGGLPVVRALAPEGAARVWRALSGSQCGPGQQRKVIATLRTMAGWMADHDIVSKALADGFARSFPDILVRVDPSADARENFWTADEWKAFTATFEKSDPWLLVFETIYWGALRLGEARALKVGDLDVARSSLMVHASITAGGIEGATKTPGSRQSVALPAWLTGRLVELVSDAPRTAPLLFPWRRVSCSTLRRVMNEHTARAGVKQITVHGLRHSIASRMIQEGVAPLVVSRHLRHSSMAITLSIYTHLFPGAAAGVIDRMSPYPDISVGTSRIKSGSKTGSICKNNRD